MKIIDKPDLYDLLYNDVVEDISMYIKILEKEEKILEFGCGTGRITIPLARNGHFVEAVDLSNTMLQSLQRKISVDSELSRLILPRLGNMCNYSANEKYNAIIIPLTSFNYLLSKEEQIGCLQTLERNMTSNGYAIIELLSTKTFLETNQSDEYVFVKDIIESEHSYYKYYRKTKLDMENRTISQLRLFKYYIDGKYVSEEIIEWNNRFVTIEDLKNLLLDTGLTIDEIYGNCSLEAYTEDSEDVFVKIKRI